MTAFSPIPDPRTVKVRVVEDFQSNGHYVYVIGRVYGEQYNRMLVGDEWIEFAGEQLQLPDKCTMKLPAGALDLFGIELDKFSAGASEELKAMMRDAIADARKVRDQVLNAHLEVPTR